MLSWLIAAVFGVGLGVGLYACVRLRMYMGPRVRDTYGQWPRRLTWLVIMLLMIGLGNVMLIGLRETLNSLGHEQNSIQHEILFAVLALLLGLTLVIAQVRRK